MERLAPAAANHSQLSSCLCHRWLCAVIGYPQELSHLQTQVNIIMVM
jgi:hypothetical protein